MPRTAYDRKDPVIYAAQRLALGARVRDGMAVRAAARFLNIPYSTAWLWVAQDGLRQADLAAEAAGAPRPPLGSWAQPGRGRKHVAQAEDSDLPPPDYPELKGLSVRARLEKLSDLASAAQMRAISAIEEGCIGFALSSMREAQKLSRAWRAMQDWQEKYPEGPDEDEAAQREARNLAMLEELTALVEGRTPVRPPRTPEQQAKDEVNDEIWAAIEAAETADLERLGLQEEDFTEEELVNRQLDLLQLSIQLEAQWEKWAALPGRGPPQLRVSLPPRKARTGTYVSDCMKPALPPEMREGWEAAEREWREKG